APVERLRRLPAKSGAETFLQRRRLPGLDHHPAGSDAGFTAIRTKREDERIGDAVEARVVEHDAGVPTGQLERCRHEMRGSTREHLMAYRARAREHDPIDA